MVYFSHLVHLRLIVNQLGGIFYFPMQRIVILEYQTFNLLAVQMRYGKPMGIECKALRTIYFVS